MALWSAELEEAWGGGASDENRQKRHDAYMTKLAMLYSKHGLDFRHGCRYAAGNEEYFKAYFAATYVSQLATLTYDAAVIEDFFHMKILPAEAGPFKMAMRFGGSWVWPGSVQARPSLYLRDQDASDMKVRSYFTLSRDSASIKDFRYLVKFASNDRREIWEALSTCHVDTCESNARCQPISICNAMQLSAQSPEQEPASEFLRIPGIHPNSLFASMLPKKIEGLKCGCSACRSPEWVSPQTYILQVLQLKCSGS